MKHKYTTHKEFSNLHTMEYSNGAMTQQEIEDLLAGLPDFDDSHHMETPSTSTPIQCPAMEMPSTTVPIDYPTMEMPSTTTPINVPSMEMPSDVIIMKEKLIHLKEEEMLSNEELASISNNITYFSEEDLHHIPNVYCRGNTFYPKQLAREVMTSMKIFCSMCNVSLATVLQPFLTEQSIGCYCKNAGCGNMCTRKRRFGEFTCSRHVKNKTTSYDYTCNMLNTACADKN